MTASQGQGPAVSIAEWLGGTVAPWPALESRAEGETHVACYYVESAELIRPRDAPPLMKLRLRDRHGLVDARMVAEEGSTPTGPAVGTFIGVRGVVESFRGRPQLRIDAFQTVVVAPEEIDLFLARSARDPDEMERELQALVGSVRDEPLRALLQRLLDPAVETGRLFRRVPAAKQNHHAYVGGLLEHTLSVAAICDALAAHYGDPVDRDLLLAGALLHDVGKTRELAVDMGFPYTTEGKLLGHIVLGIQLVADQARGLAGLEEERLTLLLHLIASHQGRYEWQSPREPRLLEALILHYADDLDAKMNQAAALVRSVREGWTSYDRSLGRELFRHSGPQAPDEPVE